MFASRQVLKDMTGGKRQKEIIAWLNERIPGRFQIGLDGWPRVHLSVVDELFGVGGKAPARKRGPALEHMKGSHGKTSHQESRST